MPSSHLILCHPFLLLTPIPPSIRVFSNETTLCMTWPKYWSFSFSIIPSKAITGLISFRMDWLDLLAVQGTLRSLLQHHSSKTSILRHSAVCTHKYIYVYMIFQNCWLVRDRSCTSKFLKRFTPLRGVQLPLCVSTHQSSIPRHSMTIIVRTSTAYTVLSKWENLNLVLDLCYYQLSQGNFHYRCLWHWSAVAHLEAKSLQEIKH